MSVVDFCVGFILAVYFTLIFAYFLSIILNALPPAQTPQQQSCLKSHCRPRKQAGRGGDTQ